MIEQAVILAAGRGNRLGQLIKDRPKSMLPVLGKPIVVRVMDRMREAGIRRFVVVVGEHDGAVASYLSSSWYPDTQVKFALQSVPTGTVDALLLAQPYLDGPFLLSSVDNLTSAEHIQNLITRFEARPDHLTALSLIAASPGEIRQSSGVVIDEDLVIDIEEKPAEPRGAWASFMLYAFSPQLLRYLPHVTVSPRGERELVSAIRAGIAQDGKVGYSVAEWRLHLTTELDLLTINKRYLQEGRDTHILSEIPGSVHIIPPVRIDPHVSVGQDAHIGPNVYLESGSTVGQGTVIRNSILLRGTTLPAGERCEGEIVSRHVRIRDAS